MRALLIFIASALLCGTAAAAPASDASIEQLLGLNRTQGFLESVFAGVDQSVKRGLNEVMKDSALTPVRASC